MWWDFSQIGGMPRRFATARRTFIGEKEDSTIEMKVRACARALRWGACGQAGQELQGEAPVGSALADHNRWSMEFAEI